MSTLTTDRPIKIQLISNGNIPIDNASGRDSYMLDFIRYLQLVGCQVEYISLDDSPGGKLPWYIIPSTLKLHTNMRVRNNLQIGRVLLKFNSLSDWVTVPIQLIYICLPKYLKNIYRAARAAVKGLTTTKNTDVVDCREFLPSSDDVAFAKIQFDRYQPDIVVVNYVFLAEILDAFSLDETGLKVILTHDIFSKRAASFKEVGIPVYAANWDWDVESMQLRKAQVLLAIQEEDAKDLKQMAPECEVICMPKAAVLHEHNVKQVPGRCLFVGSGVEHNYYGLRWFLENVWPTVIQLIPDCSLHVCGSVRDRFEETFTNVRYLQQVQMASISDQTTVE